MKAEEDECRGVARLFFIAIVYRVLMIFDFLFQ
jgi:hypothetical protein